jgi:outer membrane protein assembly factor BamD
MLCDIRKFPTIAALLCVLVAVTHLSGCRRKKYENPIGKDTQQPDKALFDKAVGDIERGRYEIARITLNTLMNTYDTSEYLAKAKLAIADSWFREGGSHAMAQAEAEYKDFILFYPTMEEAAEAQEKVCMIHYRQMEKPDRDNKHAYRAEEECRQVLTQFPNSKFAPQVQQLLRNIQEVNAEGEMRVGRFYYNKGSHPAASNRLQTLADQYPLFSAADEALWLLGNSYSNMGNRFRDKTGEAYTRIVRDYPLSPYVDEARKRLKALEFPIPEPDPVSLARMKYEQENREKKGMLSNFTGVFTKNPDTRTAAKSGTPALNSLRPTIPASVPVPAATAGAGSSDVSATVLTGQSDLDTKPDARQTPPSQPESSPDAAASAPAQASSIEPLPSNRQPLPQKGKKTSKSSGKQPKK